MTKTPLCRRGLEGARARTKQGTNRGHFSSIVEWDVRLFYSFSLSENGSTEFKCFFMTL